MGRSRRSAAEWAELLEEWSRSGRSIAEFAEARGLKARTLGWWRWKLGAKVPKPEGPAFVELVLWWVSRWCPSSLSKSTTTSGSVSRMASMPQSCDAWSLRCAEFRRAYADHARDSARGLPQLCAANSYADQAPSLCGRFRWARARQQVSSA